MEAAGFRRIAASLALGAGLLILGCSPAGRHDTARAAEPASAPAAKAAPEAKAPAVVASGYFPIAGDGGRAGCDSHAIRDSEDEWYSEDLKAAQENSLLEASRTRRPAGAATYRFTWLRSFHHPVVIRVEERSGRPAALIAKELTGKGGYDPGGIGRHLERQLTQEEAGRFGSTLARTGLLTLPTKDCDAGFGVDGAEWIVEAVDPSGYHLVVRWSPERGPTREGGTMLMGLTGWNYGDVY